MIVEYLRYTIASDRQADFIADYRRAAEPLMASKFSRTFELCQCVEDPSHFILRIEWSSAADHLEGFRGSAEFRAFFAHIKPYLSAIDEMRHYHREIALPGAGDRDG